MVLHIHSGVFQPALLHTLQGFAFSFRVLPSASGLAEGSVSETYIDVGLQRSLLPPLCSPPSTPPLLSRFLRLFLSESLRPSALP